MRYKGSVTVVLVKILREHLDDLLIEIRVNKLSRVYRIDKKSCLIYGDLALDLVFMVFFAFDRDPGFRA